MGIETAQKAQEGVGGVNNLSRRRERLPFKGGQI